MKCYTAEEIGEEVGLDEKSIRNEVSGISEELLKLLKVTFSEPSDQTCHKHADPTPHALPTTTDEMGPVTAIASNAVALQIPFFRPLLDD